MTSEPGGDGVGVGDPVGVQGVLGERYEGVPDAGAVVAGVPAFLAGFAGVLVDVVRAVGGSGSGQREERCFQQGAVLGGPAAPDPDPTGPVGDDRQAAVQMRGAFLTFQGGFEPAVGGVGVDDLDQMPARLSQLGGVQGAGVAEHQLLPPPAGPLPGRQIRHRSDDHVGLLRGHASRRPVHPGSETTDP